jgi:uncharacterized membrane protein
MSSLVVITFPNTDDAEKARTTLKALADQGLVKIEDSAVLVKDEEGNVKEHGQTSKGTSVGALGGGLLGLLIGGLLFPLAGIAIGVMGGALVGSMVGDSVDKKFVKEVKEAMAPNSSALFVLGSGDPAAISAAFRPLQGTVYHTNLAPDKEEQLREALK